MVIIIVFLSGIILGIFYQKYKNLLGNFTRYQPDPTEIIDAYEGLFRIWEKQGKDPFEELKKLERDKLK